MLTGEFQGLWWLPDSAGHVVPGTLTLTQERRPSLSVIGPIDPQQGTSDAIGTALGLSRSIPFVHGRTASGKLVTITNVQLGLRQMHLEDPASATYELVGRTAYVGSHIDPATTAFARMDLIPERIVDWCGSEPFTLSAVPSRQRPDRIEIMGKVPGPVAGDIEGGRFSVTGALSTSGDFRRNAALSVSAGFRVELDGPVNTEAWLEWYVQPLCRLLSLATGRAISPETVELSHTSSDIRTELVWPHRLGAADTERGLTSDELLFGLEDIRDQLSWHLGKWLSACRTYEPILDTFFGTRYSERMYEDDRFQNLVQTLEGYHRRRIGGRPNENAYAERRDVVLGAVPEEQREWLGNVLEHAGEYSLADRIEQLIKLHNWLVGDVVPQGARWWARRVAAARNLRTHIDPGAALVTRSLDSLVGLSQRLAVLAEACLLREIGFEEERVSEMIRRASPHYRMLRLNPLL